MNSATCFIDSNILYKYADLENIKWLEVMKSDHVLLIIAPIVLRELEDHKDSGRKPQLSTRASTVLGKLNALFEQNYTESRVQLREGVDLLVEDVDASIPIPLNPQVADDQLIANILFYRSAHPDEKVFLFTTDVSLKYKAKRYQIELKSLPKSYENPLPISLQERKIKALEDENKLLKQKPEPKLVLTFENGTDKTILRANWEIPTKTPATPTQDVISLMSMVAGFNNSIPDVQPLGCMDVIFKLKNAGTKIAEKIDICINLPQGCKIWEPKSNSFIIKPKFVNKLYHLSANPEDSYIHYTRSELIHGLTRHIDAITIRFPDPDHEYVFQWVARAGNMRNCYRGELIIIPNKKPSPPIGEKKGVSIETLIKKYGTPDEPTE